MLTGIANVSVNLHASSHANANESEITVGCTPLASNAMHLFSKAPHKTATDVVPSPATMSCDFDSSTNIFAAGCVAFIFDKIVAPSLVIVTSFFSEIIILSMPLGPNEVRIASASFFAAVMFEMRMSCFSLSSA